MVRKKERDRDQDLERTQIIVENILSTCKMCRGLHTLEIKKNIIFEIICIFTENSLLKTNENENKKKH